MDDIAKFVGYVVLIAGFAGCVWAVIDLCRYLWRVSVFTYRVTKIRKWKADAPFRGKLRSTTRLWLDTFADPPNRIRIKGAGSVDF